jgi:hypothetical protein
MLKSETILYVNATEDNPRNRPGMIGVRRSMELYWWKPDDTVDAVAAKFDASPGTS